VTQQVTPVTVQTLSRRELLLFASNTWTDRTEIALTAGSERDFRQRVASLKTRSDENPAVFSKNKPGLRE
jgi:hypothetical protein